METTERQAFLTALSGMRRRAIYWATRLGARRESAPLSFGMVARAAAIEHCLRADADWAVASTRLSAEFGAVLERLSELSRTRGEGARLAEWEHRLRELAVQDGVLRAERAKLDARLLAEHQAFATTSKLLSIRLGAPSLAR